MFEVLTAVLSVILILFVIASRYSRRKWKAAEKDWLKVLDSYEQSVRDLEAVAALSKRTEAKLHASIDDYKETIEIYKKKLNRNVGKYRKIT